MRWRGQGGQSMVEFAVVVGWFLFVLFAAVSAAFHSIQRAMAETAAGAGVQLAASASPATLDQPALQAAAFAPTRDLMKPVMFATRIVPGCDPVGLVAQSTLEVCVFTDPANPAMVGESVRGHPAYVVPFLTRWLPWSIDVTVETHEVSYQR